MWTVRQVVETVLLLVQGIWEATRSCRDFGELEVAVKRLSQEATRRLMEAALESMDERLMRERDPRRLRVVRLDSRSLVTLFGEVRWERRYYCDRVTGARRYLLDEALGLKPREVISPRLAQVVVKLATKVTYRQVAFMMEELLGGVHLSVMGLWEQVQKTGAVAADLAEQGRRQMFERGRSSAGQRPTQELFVEADEVWVAGRDERVALKLAVAYEGKVQVGPGRKALRGRRVMAAVGSPELFWEQVTADVAATWDLASASRVTLGSDGAPWLRQGSEYFPGSTHRLDPYHLRRALVQGLTHDEQAYRQVSEAIATGNWLELANALEMAQKSTQGTKRKRVRALRTYLHNNWAGIQRSGSGQQLGAIEGQVFHHVARRMKRCGAKWSRSGADHLVRLLAADGNGELDGLARTAWSFRPDLLEPAAGPEPICRALGTGGQDSAAWLQASMPALAGPASSKPWVKYVLREMARAGIGVA